MTGKSAAPQPDNSATRLTAACAPFPPMAHGPAPDPVAAFIAKWQANTRNERAACQEHFIDLCHLLDEPTPNTDPDGSNYAFEKGATKATGGDGWADVWRRGCFGWEYKGKHKDLDAAHRQLLQYAGALGNPPLLVVSDIARIVIRTNWTNTVSERHEVLLSDLADPAKRALLKAVLADPERLRPGKTREALTAQAAAEFAELARRLRDRGHDAQAVAHFVNRLVFCLFADDVDLLPPGLFEQMLAVARRSPGDFAEHARTLFHAMAQRGGRVGFVPVQWFNGGLFNDDSALPLDAADIALLERAAALDWAEIDPSILGTLFERGLDPDKRSQLGAHYTDREKIERLVDPVVRRPLLAEWAKAKTRIMELLAKVPPEPRETAAARRAKAAAKAELSAFLDRLRAFRVLDPACGSGNFLYLSLLALKDIEHQAIVEAEALGMQQEFRQVGPEAVLGIEINPYAAELARVSVWIGHIQWARRHGLPPPADPVLRPLDTIECRDAVLAPDGTPAPWPKADAIVGNPPFLGDKTMLGVLGADYTAELRRAYAGRVPGGADLVCYWFEKTRHALECGMVARAGLVGTNSIRGGANRAVLDGIARGGSIFEAWSDEAWTVEGAAVRVSLVCFSREAPSICRLDGKEVIVIHPDLTAGATDLTTAKSLPENDAVCFIGGMKKAPFDVLDQVANSWLGIAGNPNGRPNSDVVFPWMNGEDVTGRLRRYWIIDFAEMSEHEAAEYVAPFTYVMNNVKPRRIQSGSPGERRYWWRLARRAAPMLTATRSLRRFIVTPRNGKHRVFTWIVPPTFPDGQLVVIARDDDTTFGILQSRFHELWSLGKCTWLGVGNDPRYTPSTTFETFPFPNGMTPNLPAAGYATNPTAQAIAAAARDLVEKRDRWLNPPELVNIVPEVVPGFPDRIVPKNAEAAAILKARTLTNLYNTRGTPAGTWLDNLHRTLDAAVAAAYGWPTAITDDDVLARLLALNHARANPKASPVPSPTTECIP